MQTRDLTTIPGLLTVEIVPNLFLSEVRSVPDQDNRLNDKIACFSVTDREGIEESKIDISFFNMPTHVHHSTDYHQRSIDEAFNFPFIVSEETGLPFLLACNFLFHRYQFNKTGREAPTTATIRAQAYHLAHMLNFFYKHRDEFDYLNFKYPLESQRPAYKYWQFLRTEIANCNLSRDNARLHQSTSAHFFKWVFDKGLIDQKANLWAEETVNRTIHMGLRGVITKQTIRPKQAIKSSRKKPILSNVIYDGGEPLRPLNNQEQKILASALKAVAPPWLKYLSIVSLSTGARLGTVGTIREKHIPELKKQIQMGVITPYLDAGGAETLIQTKHDKHLRVYFPRFLIEYLDIYMNSNARKKDLKKAESNGLRFKDKSHQHVFINQRGNHVYHSKFNIDLIENWIPPSTTPGSGATHFVNDVLKPEMQKLGYVGDFRFHFLRATFGMNFLKGNYRHNMANEELNKLLDELKDLMGHLDIATTQSYLNYYNSNIANSPITIANEEFCHDLLLGVK